MMFIKLGSLEIVNQLCKISDKYKEQMDIDISYGRQIIDACSVLGVASLMGKIVKISPMSDNKTVVDEYLKEIEQLGGYQV